MYSVYILVYYSLVFKTSSQNSGRYSTLRSPRTDLGYDMDGMLISILHYTTIHSVNIATDTCNFCGFAVMTLKLLF